MLKIREYYYLFLKLLAGYISNEINDEDGLKNVDDSIDGYSSYIWENESDVSDESYFFSVGAAWGVTTIRMYHDNSSIWEGTEEVADAFTDMVEAFAGIKIP